MEKKSRIYLITGIVLLVILLLVSCTIKPNGEKIETLSNDPSIIMENDYSTTSISGAALSNDPSIIMENAQKESSNVQEKEKKSFNSIDVNEYLDILSSEEKQIVLVARPTCGYCKIAVPIIQKISKEYDININYLNTDEFSDEDSKRFIESNDKFQEGYVTPMLLYIESGEIKDTTDGLTDTAHYIEQLKTNGYIK